MRELKTTIQGKEDLVEKNIYIYIYIYIHIQVHIYLTFTVNVQILKGSNYDVI